VLREFERIHDRGKPSLRNADSIAAGAVATGSVILTKAACKPYQRAVAPAPSAGPSRHAGD